MAKAPVAIVGGGISGLSVAYFLARRGIRSVLFEKNSRLGGLVRTDVLDGCVLEAGPDSFIATKTELADLAAELGIADQIIPSNDSQRRVFIGQRGRLVPMPAGMVMMAPANLGAALKSSFFSTGTKLRFLQELFFRPKTRTDDVAFGDFVREHFGEEVLQSIAEPLLTGVYGGDPANLSVGSVLPRFLAYEASYGSLIRAAREERKNRKAAGSMFLSFANGMQTVIDALVQAITPWSEVRHSEVQKIRRSESNWTVETASGSFEFGQVVLATPAYISAALLEEQGTIAQHLKATPYSSAVLATCIFDRETLEHPLDGFGFLIPEPERRAIAAATWVNTKFPSRIAPHRAVVRAFVVGEGAASALNQPDSEVSDHVLADLRHWMGISTPPLTVRTQRWPRSMPQYTCGHAARIAQLEQELAALPGLHLCGNAYAGVGLPDCVKLASQTVERIASLN